MATLIPEPEVVVVGSCMTDLISYVPRLPKPGETIQGTYFSKGFGGKGANQCVMAARLGARTAMVAKLGDDAFGHSTLKNFQDNQINSDHVLTTTEAPSGVASITVNDMDGGCSLLVQFCISLADIIITKDRILIVSRLNRSLPTSEINLPLINSSGENAIVIVSGANLTLGPADVARAKSLFSKAAVVVCQLEVPPETSLAALIAGKKHGAITMLNTAPGMKGLSQEYFQNTDILCLNETEAELLTGVAVPDLSSAYRAVEVLQSYNPGCVVLTLGEKGVLFTEMGKPDTIKHQEAEKVEVVDTTGAGDAFVGALAYYLACHSVLSFEEMIRRSGIIASYSVTAPGTQASYIIERLPGELLTP